MHIVKRQLSAMYCTFLISLTLIVPGCVGSPVHSTLKYSSTQRVIKRNNNNLMKLKVGLSQEEVRSILGNPERSEGYPWGSAWLFRTAMTSGIYGTADSDFTPVAFDHNGTLVGWGRNFLVERTKRYELTIKEGGSSK